MARSCAADHQQDQRIDDPYQSTAEEPCTNAAIDAEDATAYLVVALAVGAAAGADVSWATSK